MQRVLLAALALSSTLVLAQADAGTPAATIPVAPSGDGDLRREFEAKLEAARREVKELREEMRAQLATQSVAQGWQEDWVDEKRKLELVTFDGYLRVRPELFYKFDMGRDVDQAGFALFPRSPNSLAERTQAGVNMRFRFEPTINVSEEVRVRAQIDALDNLIWGSTPDYAYSRNGGNGYWSDRNEFSIFSASQTTQHPRMIRKRPQLNCCFISNGVRTLSMRVRWVHSWGRVLLRNPRQNALHVLALRVRDKPIPEVRHVRPQHPQRRRTLERPGRLFDGLEVGVEPLAHVDTSVGSSAKTPG